MEQNVAALIIKAGKNRCRLVKGFWACEARKNKRTVPQISFRKAFNTKSKQKKRL